MDGPSNGQKIRYICLYVIVLRKSRLSLTYPVFLMARVGFSSLKANEMADHTGMGETKLGRKEILAAVLPAAAAVARRTAGSRTVVSSGLVPVTTHSLPKQTFEQRQQRPLLLTGAGPKKTDPRRPSYFSFYFLRSSHICMNIPGQSRAD